MRLWDAVYFNGRDAQRHTIKVQAADRGLVLLFADGSTLWWTRESFKIAERSTIVRLERGEAPQTEILTFNDQSILLAIKAANQSPYTFWFLMGLATSAVLVMLPVLYFWGLPAFSRFVANSVPVGWEEELGRAAQETAAPRRTHCQSADLNNAVDVIVDRLAEHQTSPYRFQVWTVDDEVLNAFAAPGGFIVLHSGLVRKTESPEELAGALAHEMQHVIQRHSTRAIFRQLSLQLLIAALLGDLEAGGPVSDFGALRYQREDEEQADVEGFALLVRARVDPEAMVNAYRLMERDGADAPEEFEYLSTHPNMRSRVERLESMAKAVTGDWRPIEIQGDWRQIRSQCDPASDTER